MLNPRVASRYAKSLLDLAVEKGQLEQVYSDMLYLQQLNKGSREFLALLRSPVVKSDVKIRAVDAVTKGKVGPITTAFTSLLINKAREAVLPEVITSFIKQYKEEKGIETVKLTTAVPNQRCCEKCHYRSGEKNRQYSKPGVGRSNRPEYYWWICIANRR